MPRLTKQMHVLTLRDHKRIEKLLQCMGVQVHARTCHISQKKVYVLNTRRHQSDGKLFGYVCVLFKQANRPWTDLSACKCSANTLDPLHTSLHMAWHW